MELSKDCSICKDSEGIVRYFTIIVGKQPPINYIRTICDDCFDDTSDGTILEYLQFTLNVEEIHHA